MRPIYRQPLPTWLLFAYVRRLVRKRFARVVLHAEPAWIDAAENYPVILAGTHYYWWDGLLETLLFERWGWSYAVMMEERNLAQYPYFRRTGVFGVDLTSTAGKAAAVRQAAKWLRATGQPETWPARPPYRRVLVVYPHGRIVSDLGPWPPLEPGVAALARLTGARVVPFAKRLVAAGEPLPTAHLALGEPLAGAAATDTATIDAALHATDQALVEWVRAGATGGVHLGAGK